MSDMVQAVGRRKPGALTAALLWRLCERTGLGFSRSLQESERVNFQVCLANTSNIGGPRDTSGTQAVVEVLRHLVSEGISRAADM